MLRGDWGRVVTFAVSPPSNHWTNNCVLPSRLDKKASRSPEGDHRGELKLPDPLTSGRWLFPLVSTTQIVRRARSVMMSIDVRT